MQFLPAGDALARLDAFAGEWETTGTLASGVRFRATDTYEWVAGGHFLLHRFDAEMPDGSMQGIEVIGHDPARGTYPMHSFDSSGNTSVMHAKADGDAWTFEGTTMRFTGGFRDGGSVFEGAWESRDADGSPWTPAMTVTLRKR